METEAVGEYFKQDLFASETTGIEILEVRPNYARTCLKIEGKHLNAEGVVMGGCIYTVADFTFAIASNAGNSPTSTLNSSIVFNSPATGDMLFGETSLVKNGRSVCTFTVSVTDENGRLIAVATMLGFRKS